MTKAADRAALAEARLAFRTIVLALDQRCIVHDDPADCEGEIAAHHVVTQQHLRKQGHAALLWDPRDGTAVCEAAHRHHHSGRARIEIARLPLRCVKFAQELGLDWYIDRYYIG